MHREIEGEIWYGKYPITETHQVPYQCRGDGEQIPASSLESLRS